MKRQISFIVEGEGEVHAVPPLVRRMLEDCGEFEVQILRPIRVHRDQFLNNGPQRSRYLRLAQAAVAGTQGVVIVLVDADDDCVAQLVSRLLPQIHEVIPSVPYGLVVANREFEAWFIAGVGSLAGQSGFHGDVSQPPDAESIRDAKGWLKRELIASGVYKEVIDQAQLAARVDWRLARQSSPSLDKFCRELGTLLNVTSLIGDKV